MAEHTIRKKVLIPLTLTFVVLIVAFVWAGYGIRRTDEQQLLQQHFWSAQRVLEGLLSEQAAVLVSTADFIASQPLLQSAIAQQDIPLLTGLSGPLLERLSRQLNITHFYYYDGQGQLLLRVYFPEDISQPAARRKNLQQAMASGRPVSGLEIGRHGTFAQRLVFPWYAKGELLGYIELGTELRHILLKLKNITQVDLTIAIHKKHVFAQNWSEYAVRHQTDSRWDFLDDKLISDSTLQISQKMAEAVFSKTDHGAFEEELTLGQKTYRGALQPVSDAHGQVVGDLLMLVDVTGHKKVFYNFLFWVVGLSLLLTSALFGFAYRILGRMGAQLTLSEDHLKQERSSLAQANENLQKEIKVRIHAETQLIDVNQTLEQRVSERTRELAQQNLLLEKNRNALEAAYRELKEKQAAILHQDKMACIGQLAAGIAHDINNPVGFISHNLTLLDRYLQRLFQFSVLQRQLVKSRAADELLLASEKNWNDFKVDEVFAEFPVMLQECQDGTTRITQIVRGLRSFIHNESPEYELTDLHHCLDSTLTLLRHELRDKIRVVKDYQPIPRRYCYGQQMNQLFMNLLLNACQAIAGSGEIQIRTWTDQQQIFIVISDNGCGIPPEELEKIYDPFFTTKPIGVGTGLGLSIVFEVVTRHHGTVAVVSEVGRGTSFTLTFPCDDRKTPRKLQAPALTEPAAGDAHG
jgi:signal transduction histidine kinase